MSFFIRIIFQHHERLVRYATKQKYVMLQMNFVHKTEQELLMKSEIVKRGNQFCYLLGALNTFRLPISA